MLRSLRLPAVVAALALLLAAAISATDAPSARAVAPANADFQRTWARTDQPVAAAEISRTWIWGPEANTGAVPEEYSDSPGGVREVQYFDKSRMEINDPNGDRNDPFFVTNGLLVVELMTGRLQLGDNEFEAHDPAGIPVAGDPDDTTGPTYTALSGLRAAPPLEDGETVIQFVDRNGFVDEDPALASHGITAAHHVQVPGIDHQVASVFWEIMNSTSLVFVDGAYVEELLFLNPFYATGYPLIDPYFAEVKVADEMRTVLVQCFERRCLTWTPGNSPGFVTETGNVGLHYHYWRYVLIPDEGNPTATATATETEPTESPTVTETSTETATPSETPTETVTVSPTVTAGTEYEFQASWGSQVDEDSALFAPMGIATDSEGYVYVLDSGNNRVVKYDSTGRWITSWGEEGDGEGEFFGPMGIFVGENGGNEVVLVADTSNDRIQQFGLDGGFQREEGEPGDGEAEFTQPNAVLIGGSDIYVADTGNDRIQRFGRLSLNFISEWGKSGTEVEEFDQPVALARDGAGFLYVVDMLNYRVQVFDPQGTFFSAFGEEGEDEDQFQLPVGIAVDGEERIYVVDQFAGVVKVFVQEGQDYDYLDTIGEPGEGPGQFSQPNGIAIGPDGFIYVTDLFTNSVMMFAPFDEGGEFIGSWAGGERGSFEMASGIAVDEDLRVFVTDIETDLVQIFDTSGAYISNFGGPGDDEGFFDQPSDVDVDDLGRVYVADTGNGRVQKFSATLVFLEEIGSPGAEEDELDEPVDVAVDGDVFVADQGNARVKVFTDDGEFVTQWGSEGDDADFDDITGIAAFDGMVYVVEQGADRVQIFEDNGDFVSSFGETGIEEGQFGRISRIAVSADGYLFITDESRNVVLIFTLDGDFVTEFGEDGDNDGEFNTPIGVALDQDRNVYVVDQGNYRVQKFVPVVE